MGVTVLIIDDDEGVRYYHRIIVAQSGLSAHPLCFSYAEDAFDYLDQKWNEKDTYLILLDINMPLMNGWDMLDEIKTKSYCNQVYIVIVSSSVEKVNQEKAKSYSMVIDLVEKPISNEDCKRLLNFSPISKDF